MKRSESIFISYRRSDSNAEAGRIDDRLVKRFSRNHVFKDVDSLPPGVDFADRLDEVLSHCDVVLVLIGKTWLEAKNPDGTRRLDDPGDFVRREVESALSRDDVHVIPVLLEGASMPPSDDLPEAIRPLCRSNAISVGHDPRFHSDVDRLIKGIERQLNSSSALPKKPGIFLWGFVLVAVLVLVFFVYRGQNTSQVNDPPRTDTPNPDVSEKPDSVTRDTSKPIFYSANELYDANGTLKDRKIRRWYNLGEEFEEKNEENYVESSPSVMEGGKKSLEFEGKNISGTILEKNDGARIFVPDEESTSDVDRLLLSKDKGETWSYNWADDATPLIIFITYCSSDSESEHCQ